MSEMKKKLITEINRYRELMGEEPLNESIITEREVRVLSNFKGDIQNGPKYHQSRALGNWQSDNAWDLFAPAGTKWYAITKGTVSKVYNTGKNSGKIYGTQVTVKGEDGFPNIFYTHLKNVVVSVGDKVDIGDLIGEVSEWGKSKGTHVHVGLPYGKHIDKLLSSDYSKPKGFSSPKKEKVSGNQSQLDVDTKSNAPSTGAIIGKSSGSFNFDKKNDLSFSDVKSSASDLLKNKKLSAPEKAIADAITKLFTKA
jgi:murein DD-endopeptidase MepM/ murein hydrolase activator NlpD